MKKGASREDIIRTLRKELPSLRDQFGVERIALYGSFAKGTQGETSDIDLLVQLSRPLGFEFIHLAERLESALGRQVDLATVDSLRRSASDPRRASIADDIQRTMIYV